MNSNRICASQRAAIEVVGDRDCFFLYPSGDRYRITLETNQAAPGSCPTIDTELSLWQFNEVFTSGDDDSGINFCSKLSYTSPLPISRSLFWACVEDHGANNTIAEYGLTYSAESLWRNEFEPNNTPALADPMCGGYNGQLSPEGDVDYLKLNMVIGSTLTAETSTGFGDCAPPTDTFLEVLDAGGNVVASSDDEGVNQCSLVTYVATYNGIVRLKVSDFGNDDEIDFYSLALAYTLP
ncbi:MAG: hypothetical protein ABI639_17045 [Thermoanaerobaculia bacterium]